jgi:ubiquinone/menaquinone biosynthesis C-methylase UbiE
MTDDMRGDIPDDQPIGADRSRIASFFDEMAGTREAVFRSNPVIDYEQQVRASAVLDALQPQAGDVILDIGCGNARDITPMLQRGATIVGVDLSEGMIAQARRDLEAAGFSGVTLEVGDATSLRFADATFDKVVCSEVIEHIPDTDRAIAEMQRVLKPGGLLVVSTPNRHSWYGFERFVLWDKVMRRPWNHPFDNWRTAAQVQTLLRRHGFTIERAASGCFLPGFLLTYRLPRAAQRVVVSVVRKTEPMARAFAPQRGYTLVVTASKAAAASAAGHIGHGRSQRT